METVIKVIQSAKRQKEVYQITNCFTDEKHLVDLIREALDIDASLQNIPLGGTIWPADTEHPRQR